MNRSHRTLDGAWAECNDETCPLLFHFDLTVEAAQELPEAVFVQLAEGIDPPSKIHMMFAFKEWLDEDQLIHRDYDLPARIYADGAREWYQRGIPKRHGDKPNQISGDGSQHWVDQDRFYHRENDLPAEVHLNGAQGWWRHGVKHHSKGPAVVCSDGREEYWVDGVQRVHVRETYHD